jgi:hypothetical protein
MLDPLAVARKRLLALWAIDRLVERAMRLTKILRHDIGIVEVGKRGAFMRRARVEHIFRDAFEFLLVVLVFDATGSWHISVWKGEGAPALLR